MRPGFPTSLRYEGNSATTRRLWWRRCCCAAGRRPNSTTRRTGCSPTTRCNRPPRNRWPSTGHGGWRAPLCTMSPVRSAQSLRHCGTRPASWWAATSTRSGSPWPGTTSATWRCAAPTRCDPSPATPSSLADPARRRSGRRRFDPRDYIPPLDRLLDVYRDRDLVVKCAPGIDFDELERLGFGGEIEVTSLRRQRARGMPVVAGPGRVGRAPPRHHAGRSPNRSPTQNPTTARWRRRADGSSTPTVRWSAPDWSATTPPGTGCGSSTPTSPTCPATGCPTVCAASRCSTRLGYSEKRLRQALSAHDAGAVEILVRGVDVDPDALRRRLKLRGSQQVSVVITRIGSGTASRATAFICRPSR